MNTAYRLTFLRLTLLLLALALPAWAQSPDQQRASVVKVTAKVEGKRKTGTGFLVRVEPEAAYILTAAHVVEGDNQPEVEFFTRRNVSVRAQTARIEGGDPRGLALLIVHGKANLPAGIAALPLATGGALGGGEPVTVIGFPQGGGPWAVVRATVTAREGRDLTLDGSIEEGNSGGPVLDAGSVVGVITTVQGRFARAVPASLARLVLEGWGVDLAGPVGPDQRPTAKVPTPERTATRPSEASAAAPHLGSVRIQHSACEKLLAAANYRITLSGEGQGPTGAVLRAAIRHDDRNLSTPKPACTDWKTCQRQPDEPEKTRWRTSVLTVGPAPTHATVSLEPERTGSADAAYAVARVELDCLRP